jgi:hypothetical protein
MKKQIGLLAIIALIVSFMAFSGVASAQASNVQVVFFEQPGCSACAAALPIVQSAAAKYGVTLTVYNTLDPGQGKGLATANGVTVTPTIIVSGAQSARYEGSVTQAQMETAIQAAIGTTPTATPTPIIKAVTTTTPAKTVVKATTTPAKTVVKATTTPKTPVKAVAVKTDTKTVVKTSKQPTIVVATATQTPTTPTQTVPEFSLLGLGAPALVVAAVYLFLRRR